MNYANAIAILTRMKNSFGDEESLKALDLAIDVLVDYACGELGGNYLLKIEEAFKIGGGENG